MTARCPVCGVDVDIVPGYMDSGRVYEFARCPNIACPVVSIRIEWRDVP